MKTCQNLYPLIAKIPGERYIHECCRATFETPAKMMQMIYQHYVSVLLTLISSYLIFVLGSQFLHKELEKILDINYFSPVFLSNKDRKSSSFYFFHGRT